MYRINVIRPIRVSPGVIVDSKTLTETSWVLPGLHTIDTTRENLDTWVISGNIEIMEEDGKPFIHAPCC